MKSSLMNKTTPIGFLPLTQDEIELLRFLYKGGNFTIEQLDGINSISSKLKNAFPTVKRTKNLELLGPSFRDLINELMEYDNTNGGSTDQASCTVDSSTDSLRETLKTVDEW